MLQSTPRGRGGRSRSRGRSKGPTPAQAAGGDNNELIDRFIEQLSGYNTQDVVASDSVNFSNTYKNIKKEFGAVLPQREMQVLQDRMNAAHARGGGSGTLIGGKGSSESFGDLYHVLSIAFLLMEEERETFQKQLREVEDFFVKRAKHAGLISLQSIARKILYRELSLGFSAWVQFAREMEGSAQARKHMQRLTEAQKRMEAERKAQEAERMENVGRKVIARMRKGGMARTFKLWRDNVNEIVYNRHVVKKFALKMKNQKAHSAIVTWKELVGKRKWARGLLNRLLGGKDVLLCSAAFRQWYRVHNQLDAQDNENRLADMEAKIEEQAALLNEMAAMNKLLENSLGAMQKQKHEAAMKSAQKMIRLMKGKALTSTFMAWIAFTKEAVGERVKMTRFLAKWKNQGLSKCYMAWTQYVTEEKRYRYLVNRFLQRLNNGVVFRIFAAWVSMIEENKHNKIIIARFRTRMMNMEVAKSLGSWKEFVGLRLRMKYLARRIINRCENGQFLSAWIPWVEFTAAAREKEEKEREMEFMSAAQREEEEQRQKIIDEQNAEKERMCREHEQARDQLNQMKLAEAERKKELGLKMIQNMMNGCLARVLQGWKEYVRVEKYNRAVIKRFAKKLAMRAANSAYSRWLDYWKERKWLRGLLNRMLGGKEMMLRSAAFKQWAWASKEMGISSKHNSELEELRAKLSQAESFHEESIKSAADEKMLMSQKLLKKTIYTLQNASLGKCFSAWSHFVSIQHHTRKLVNKVFSRVTNREITAGLNKWKNAVKAWKEAEGVLVAKNGRRNKGMQMLADKANTMRIRTGSMKQAFVKWMLATYTVTLSGRAVKRLDNFMLMFAHAFSSAKEVKQLVSVTCECLQSMISGAAGTLMLLDKPSQEMWTYKSGAERRSPMQQGIMGYVGKTSESIYADMFSDERYNPAIDDIMLSKGESSPQASKTWWGANMPNINHSAGSPVILCIPVRDFDGVTVAVLAAVRVHVETGQSVKPFNPNDALALAVLSCYVGGHLEKLQGKLKGDVSINYESVHSNLPDVSTPPARPLAGERSTMSSLVKKMEQKANTMEQQASTLQSSTKNLERRLRSMSSYAKELEGKMGSDLTIDTEGGGAGAGAGGYQSYTGGSPVMVGVVDRAMAGQGPPATSPSSPGHKAWQQHTQALQKLFEVEKSLK
ncbi:hypothetical protein TrST_g3525 [Triparma strigata]|nr:hypothetical protein TrST_g3525 [Triparma strigata]